MEVKLFQAATRQENGRYGPHTKEKRQQIHRILYQLYDVEKKSTVQIAKQFNTSATTIRYWLKKTGIPIRSISQSATLRIYKQLKTGYQALSEEKAYLLGVLCGDGSIIRNSIQLHACDFDFIQEFSHCLYKIYGYKPHISIIPENLSFFQNTGKYHRVKQSYRARLSSKEISQDLRRYEYFVKYEERKSMWRVPREIVNTTNKEIKGAFLRGLFDSEGSVAIRARQIELINTCEEGLKQVQKLLATLGIQSSIIHRSATFDLMIHGTENFRLYKEGVGFTIKRKQEKLEKICQNRSIKHDADTYWFILECYSYGVRRPIKISKITGVSPTTILDWVNGKKIPPEAKFAIKTNKLPKKWKWLKLKYPFLKEVN
jgi:hypothetical protein